MSEALNYTHVGQSPLQDQSPEPDSKENNNEDKSHRLLFIIVVNPPLQDVKTVNLSFQA
jgi:hypothetical protein